MRRFFVRELLRLAPVALATAFLGVLVYVGLAYLSPGSWAHGAADHAYLIVLLGAPWLLGSASIAPDAESGALTFMATLPVRSGRQLAARILAALGYALLVPAVAWLLLQPESAGKRPTWFVYPPETLFAVVFLGAVLASATIRNALAAFMITPLLVGLPLAGIVELGIYWQWVSVIEVLFMGLTLCVGVGAWTAFVHGDHHGRLWSPRTLRLGLSVVLVPMLLLAGLSSAVSAYDWSGRWVAYPRYRMQLLPAGLVNVVRKRVLTGDPTDYTLANDRWCFRDEQGRWQGLALGEQPGSISPDGRRILVVSERYGGDERVPARVVDRSGSNQPRRGTWGWTGEMSSLAAVWRDQPYQIVQAGLLGLDGTLLPWPEQVGARASERVDQLGGPTLVIRAEDGVWVWTEAGLRRPPAEPLVDEAGERWARVSEPCLSPGGRYLWTLSAQPDAGRPDPEVTDFAPRPLLRPWRLQVLDLSSDTPWRTVWQGDYRWWPLDSTDVDWGRDRPAACFSPDESYLVVVGDDTALVCLANGQTTAVALENGQPWEIGWGSHELVLPHPGGGLARLDPEGLEWLPWPTELTLPAEIHEDDLYYAGLDSESRLLWWSADAFWRLDLRARTWERLGDTDALVAPALEDSMRR